MVGWCRKQPGYIMMSWFLWTNLDRLRNLISELNLHMLNFQELCYCSGTRETAFVHAISSAGVAHAVTRSCSTGTIDRCGCDRTVQDRVKDGFEWSGCSDNIAYGNAFAKTFVDARERVKGNSECKGLVTISNSNAAVVKPSVKGSAASKALMNLHNNNAGRKVTSL